MKGTIVALTAFFVVLALSTPAALASPCGLRSNGTQTAGAATEPSAADALFVLNRAVGRAGYCGLCTCDVDASGDILVYDAMRVLQRAVGLDVELSCPPCECRATLSLLTGESPRSVVVGDLDDDGLLDLIAASTDSDQISIFMGDSRGEASRSVTIDVADTPQSVAVADLDGDGALDLIVSHALPDAISVLMGDGGGNFSVPTMIPAGKAPINTAVGDLDRDGILDIVVANSTGNDLSIRLGIGDGTFGPQRRQAVGSGPRWVALGLIDSDDLLDAVVANRDSDDISILLGNGDGSFHALARLPVPAGPYHVSLANMDANATMDLVVASFSAETVSVIPGNGDGSFGPAVSLASGGRAIATAVADLDGDGNQDLSVANYLGGPTVFFGSEEGTWEDRHSLRIGGASGRPPRGVRALAIADWNRDGLPDIITASSKGDDLSIFRNTGDRSFHTGLFSTATVLTVDFLMTDFNRDGRPDLATADHRGATTVVLGQGDGRFGPRSILGLAGIPKAIRTADLNGDGLDDLVISTEGVFFDLLARSAANWADENPSISVLLGQPQGGFETEARLPGLPFTREIALGDVSGDGVPDLLGSEIQTHEIFVRPGNGDGSFGTALPVAGANAGWDLELLDINGDELPDLLSTNASLGRSLRLGLAGGGFGEARPLPDPRPLTELPGRLGTPATGDVNGDGALDLVFTFTPTAENGEDAQVWAFLGNGGGEFAPPTISRIGPAWQDPRKPRLGDLDGDLALDLAATIDSGVLLMRGDGSGGFRDPFVAKMRTLWGRYYSRARAVAIADFDEDGRADVVAVLNGDYGDNYFRTLPEAGSCLSP